MKHNRLLDSFEFLNDPVSAIELKEKNKFDEIAGSWSTSIVLFGAGNLGQKTLDGLRHKGIEPLAFIDNNPLLWNSIINGLQVYSPKDGIRRFKDSAVFVVTIWRHGSVDKMSDHKRQLMEMGCHRITDFTSLFCKYSDEYLPYYMIDLPSHIFLQKNRIIQAADIWFDEGSRNTYLSEIKFRALLEFENTSTIINHPTFFPPEFYENSRPEIFIDCGAYNGDTIKSFLESHSGFEKIIAFEPDTLSFPILLQNIRTLPETIQHKINAYQLGVAGCNQEYPFNAVGLPSSSIGTGIEIIKCVRLDDFVNLPPTHIKMDIEGAEADALAGAAKLITRFHPKLSICVYHRPSDLWEIPLLIKSMVPKYKLRLRQHQLEHWDTVCYANMSHANEA